MNKRAAIGLAALIGLGSTAYLLTRTTPSSPAPPVQHALSHDEQWNRALNRDGIRISAPLLQQYPMFQRMAATHELLPEQALLEEKLLLDASTIARHAFERHPLPDRYDERIFFGVFSSAKWYEQLVNPQATAQLVRLHEHPVYDELRRIPRHDPSTLLNAAIGITYETLRPVPNSRTSNRQEFEAHVRAGVGDCTEYTYLAANLYYALCEDFAEDEHLDDIRIAFGCALNANGTFGNWHNWIQLRHDERWLDIEVSGADTLDAPFNGKTPLLAYMAGRTVTAPLLTNRVTLTDGRKILDMYAHLVPKR